MRDAISDARVVASVASTRSRRQSRYAVRAHRSREEQQLVASLVTAAKPLLEQEERRASPVAESIARAVLAGSATRGPHHVIVLSDARHVHRSSLGKWDFECGPLPDPDAFAAGLQRLVPRESWRGVTVHFVNVQLERVANDRCPATLERYAAIRNVWIATMRATGARVTWSMDTTVTINGGRS